MELLSFYEVDYFNNTSLLLLCLVQLTKDFRDSGLHFHLVRGFSKELKRADQVKEAEPETSWLLT